MDATLIDEGHASGDPGVVSGPTPRSQHAAGDVLDRRYRLRARLGRGGFGDVWRAEELLPDGAPFRDVALKLLVSDFAEESDWTEEAKLLASFRHPSLVTIYAAGILNEAPRSPFVSMELLEGCTLADLGRHRGRIPWRRVMAWARDVAGALDVIHARGVVHLDLKPANLFLTRDGSLKVLDFGISRRAGAAAGPRAVHGSATTPASGDVGTAAFLAQLDVYASTRRAFEGASNPSAARSVIGTPGFMAPEILEMAEPTAAADAYALAVCIVQLATGRLPHDVPEEPRDCQEPGLVTAWWAELRDATLRGALRDLARDPARLPAGLLALLQRLLAVDPAHRRVVAGGLKPLLDEVGERPHGVPSPPYLGLEPLPATAEGLLFGRDDDIARLGRELEFEPCVVLQGPRGAGKSSLASAGLVPHLARRHVDLKDDWIEARVQPGGDPDGALARALAGISPALERASVEELSRYCMTSPIGVVLVIDPISQIDAWAPGSPVPDGAPRPTPQAGGRLSALVTELATGEVRRGLRLVGVLAEEATAAFLATPAGAGLRAALRYVGLPALAAVKDMVAGPAKLAGVEVRDIEPVNDEVQREIRGGGPTLCFVALALAAFWGTRERGVLRGAAWVELGGVHGALARHADSVRAALSEDERAIADEVLLRLGAVNGTRIRWQEDELVDVACGGAAEARGPTGAASDVTRVLEALSRARLLTRRDGALELAHEALLTGWPHLRGVRAQHMDRLIFYERLHESAEVWDRAGEHADYLLRGELLDRAAGPGMLARLPRLERAFVHASLRRARWRKVGRASAAVLLGAAIAAGITGKRLLDEQQIAAEEARRAAEDRADLAEIVGKSRRTEDPFHRAAWIAEAMQRRAHDGMLPLDLASAVFGLPRAYFLTLDPVASPSVPWDDRWVLAAGPSGSLVVADLRPPDPEVIEDLELDVDPESIGVRIKTPRVITLRPHAAPMAERVPFAFDTAVATRSVTGEVRVFRLREGGTASLAAIAPMRCTSGLHVADAAPVVVCASDGGIARWDLRRVDAVDRHAFRGAVLGVSPDGARVAAVLGRRVLLWEPGQDGAAARSAEVVLTSPVVLGRWSPRDPVIALVQQGRTSVYAVDRPDAPLMELETNPVPASARWDAGGLDLGICGLGDPAWHYLRTGGRAADDPPPEGSPCAAPAGKDAAAPVRVASDAGDLALRDVGPHALAGGWMLPDGRVLTRDLVLFSPGPPAAAGLLRFEGRGPAGGEEPRAAEDSAALVVRGDETVAWQIGGDVRLYGARDHRRILSRKGKLLRRCDDGRMLALRVEGDGERGSPTHGEGGGYRIFDVMSEATVATVPRVPAFVLGLDAACATLFTQELDGNVIATPLSEPPRRATIAVTDGYVYDVRPSPARGGVGAGSWLAFSSGAIARIDDSRGELRMYGYATPRATAIADGPRPGEVVFADASGIVVLQPTGVAERVLESAGGAEWEDIAIAPDGETMLLSSSEKLSVLDVARREIIGSIPSEGRERLTVWDDGGSVLAWSFGRVGGATGLVVPRGLSLAKLAADAVSNLRVQDKRLGVKP